MTQPLTEDEQRVKALVAFSTRGTPNKGKHVHFRYTKGWGPGTKLNWSTAYPDKDTAARAIAQWAGKKWKARVILEAEKEVSAQTAAPAASISMMEPLSPEERRVLHGVKFVPRRAKKKGAKASFAFRYTGEWGPPTKMKLSSYYPSKACAARALWLWAGADWEERVHCQHQAMPLALELDTEDPEAMITMAIRPMRMQVLKWLQKHITVSKGDEDQAAMLAIVEDDALSQPLLDLFNSGGSAEDVSDCLEEVLKCETDKWKGHVVWLGPKALVPALKGQPGTIPIYTLEELKEKGSFPEGGCLVNYRMHFVPFWKKECNGTFSSRPWVPREAYEPFAEPYVELAEQLGCNLDMTVRAAGDCMLHAALVLLDLLRAGNAVPVPLADTEGGSEEEKLPLEAGDDQESSTDSSITNWNWKRFQVFPKCH